MSLLPLLGLLSGKEGGIICIFAISVRDSFGSYLFLEDPFV